MEPTSIVKVTAAFTAGMVVALGSALIYVRATEAPPKPVYQIPAASPRQTEAEPEPPVPAEKTAEPVTRPAPTVVKHAVIRRVSSATVKSRPPIEVAQNVMVPAKLPPAEAPSPVPEQAPAVNEQQQPPFVPPDPEPLPVDQPPTQAQAQPEPHVVTLPAGSNLVIRLGETISTDHNYAGDTFRGSLENRIVLDGFIIAEKGSKVLGRILSAAKAGHLEGASTLQLALTEINTTDGQRVQIETGIFAKKGPTSAGENAATIAGGAALGAIIGALGDGGKGAAIGAGVGGAAGTGAVLLTRPRPAVIPAETRLTFQIARPAVITEKLN